MKLAQFSTLQTRKAVLTSLTWALLIIVVVSWQCKASSTQLRNSEAFVFFMSFYKTNKQQNQYKHEGKIKIRLF